MTPKSHWQHLRLQASRARRTGDHEAAEKLLIQALAEARSFPIDDEDLTRTMNALADVQRRQGKLAEAEAIGREAVELGRRYRPGHGLLGNDLMFLSQVVEERGRTAEAIELIREALPIYEETMGKDHGEVRYIRSVLARLLAAE